MRFLLAFLTWALLFASSAALVAAAPLETTRMAYIERDGDQWPLSSLSAAAPNAYAVVTVTVNDQPAHTHLPQPHRAEKDERKKKHAAGHRDDDAATASTKPSAAPSSSPSTSTTDSFAGYYRATNWIWLVLAVAIPLVAFAVAGGIYLIYYACQARKGKKKAGEITGPARAEDEERGDGFGGMVMVDKVRVDVDETTAGSSVDNNSQAEFVDVRLHDDHDHAVAVVDHTSASARSSLPCAGPHPHSHPHRVLALRRVGPLQQLQSSRTGTGTGTGGANPLPLALPAAAAHRAALGPVDEFGHSLHTDPLASSSSYGGVNDTSNVSTHRGVSDIVEFCRSRSWLPPAFAPEAARDDDDNEPPADEAAESPSVNEVIYFVTPPTDVSDSDHPSQRSSSPSVRSQSSHSDPDPSSIAKMKNNDNDDEEDEDNPLQPPPLLPFLSPLLATLPKPARLLDVPWTHPEGIRARSPPVFAISSDTAAAAAGPSDTKERRKPRYHVPELDDPIDLATSDDRSVARRSPLQALPLELRIEAMKERRRARMSMSTVAAGQSLTCPDHWLSSDLYNPRDPPRPLIMAPA